MAGADGTEQLKKSKCRIFGSLSENGRQILYFSQKHFETLRPVVRKVVANASLKKRGWTGGGRAQGTWLGELVGRNSPSRTVSWQVGGFPLLIVFSWRAPEPGRQPTDVSRPIQVFQSLEQGPGGGGIADGKGRWWVIHHPLGSGTGSGTRTDSH